MEENEPFYPLKYICKANAEHYANAGKNPVFDAVDIAQRCEQVVTEFVYDCGKIIYKITAKNIFEMGGNCLTIEQMYSTKEFDTEYFRTSTDKMMGALLRKVLENEYRIPTKRPAPSVPFHPDHIEPCPTATPVLK